MEVRTLMTRPTMTREDYVGITSTAFMLMVFACLVLLATVPPPVPGALRIEPLPIKTIDLQPGEEQGP